MSPPHSKSVAKGFQKSWHSRDHPLQQMRKTWRFAGEVVPASERKPHNGWSAAEQLQWCWKTAGLMPTEAHALRDGPCFPSRWSACRQVSPGCQCQPVARRWPQQKRSSKKLRAQDQRSRSNPQKELQPKEKPCGRRCGLLFCEKVEAFCSEDREGLTTPAPAVGIELNRRANARCASTGSAWREIGIKPRTPQALA